MKINTKSLMFTAGLFLGSYGVYRTVDKIICNNKTTRRLYHYYRTANQWLCNKDRNINIADFFAEQGIKSIAVYGMGELGKRFVAELKNSAVEIKYVIDKHPDLLYDNIKIISLEQLQEKGAEPVDMVIVTPIHDFEKIEKAISGCGDFDIVSLEDVIFYFAWD